MHASPWRTISRSLRDRAVSSFIFPVSSNRRIQTAAASLLFLSGPACSLLVDTAGLREGKTDSGPSDKPTDETAATDTTDERTADVANDSGAAIGADSSSDATQDAASDAISCQPLHASCRQEPCCAGLQCGDDKVCLTC